jgi:hypothetical protein
MEMTVQVPFQQLLDWVKGLTPSQKAILKKELEEEKVENKVAETDKEKFIQLLLDAPVYSEEDIAIIEENRKSINRWRRKN